MPLTKYFSKKAQTGKTQALDIKTYLCISAS